MFGSTPQNFIGGVMVSGLAMMWLKIVDLVLINNHSLTRHIQETARYRNMTKL